MNLHLGNNMVVPEKEIIGIFDLDTSTVSKHTRAYLKQKEQEGKVVSITTDLPKSFILCGGKEETIYLSQISTGTLKNRMGYLERLKHSTEQE